MGRSHHKNTFRTAFVILSLALTYHITTANAFITMGFLEKFIPQAPIPTSATEPCPKGSANCIRTTWTAPAGVKAKQAVDQVQTAFNAYPQEGQNKVDLSGWKVAQGSWDDDKEGALAGNPVRLEYTSGAGFFAKLLNGGKGFIDDLIVEVKTDRQPIQAELRSSSRMGKSDLGVNKKRLLFLGEQIRKQGWEAPEPEYP